LKSHSDWDKINWSKLYFILTVEIFERAEKGKEEIRDERINCYIREEEKNKKYKLKHHQFNKILTAENLKKNDEFYS